MLPAIPAPRVLSVSRRFNTRFSARQFPHATRKTVPPSVSWLTERQDRQTLCDDSATLYFNRLQACLRRPICPFPATNGEQRLYGQRGKPWWKVRKRLMGQFTLQEKKQSGIGATAFTTQPEMHCFPKESETRAIASLSLSTVKRRTVSRAICDRVSVDARLDIISDYVWKCGERRWAGTRQASLRDVAGSRAGREYIRRSYGAYGITVADANGAKEIDCYV
ncbi:hypothetical protein GGE67_005322 [Rhizobium leucaenae]|uniref:Uncharacterized protein n=1 Tax=Rhizobium leucaenae TaxID=29450 RepID=A0A7W7EM32_9HYPH|nr:hypothetical protein [Rhizobium leucaenae]MBB6304672.1 hypothetical protein [Rhizobium leucaenae]